MKKLFALLLALLLALGCAACGEELPEPENLTTQPSAAETPKDIVVLFTSDVHCGIDQGFGYAGLAAVKDALKVNNHVLLVDNGDAIQGEPIGTVTAGEAIIELMNAVGYDAAIPGNHEFDYGMDRFLELSGKAKFPYLSANFSKDGNTVLPPYIIKDCGGTKVALIGVTTPKTLTSSTPKYFQDENGNFIYGFMQDATGEKLWASVQSAVDSARKEGAQYVVVLGHMGNEEALAPYTYAELLANTTGIDALLDGHSHDTDHVAMKNKEGKDVLRAACGTKLSGIGYLRITVDGKLSTGLLNWNDDTPFTALFGTNAIAKAVSEASAALEGKLSEVVAKTDVALTITDPTAKDAEGNPIRIIRSQETNLGNLVADAYRDQTGADIAFANGGGIRASIPAGDITLGQILSVQPYGNSLCMVGATGQQILDALEWGARAVPGESGGFLQVSGLTYEIDTTVTGTCTSDENGMFTGVSGAYRVKNVKVGGEELDLTKTYKLASHNYMLKNSGDGFAMFQGCTLLLDEVKLDNQALIDYITVTLGGTVGAQYADPYGEGRITIPA